MKITKFEIGMAIFLVVGFILSISMMNSSCNKFIAQKKEAIKIKHQCALQECRPDKTFEACVICADHVCDLDNGVRRIAACRGVAYGEGEL